MRTLGAFAGTAVNDLSSVVAVGGLYGASALHTAIIVKLTRTLMIAPLCLFLARFSGPHAETSSTGGAPGRRRLPVPAFLLGFFLLATLRGVGVLPASWSGAESALATVLITVALSAVGLSVDVAGRRRAGFKPIVLGAALWVTVSALSLGCQAAGLL